MISNKLYILIPSILLSFLFSNHGFSQDETQDNTKIGKDIIHFGFQNARPIWLRSSLSKLKYIWARKTDNAQEQERLKGIKTLSKEWNREMRLRYGIFEAHYDNGKIPLGLSQTDQGGIKDELLFRGAVRAPLFGRKGKKSLNVNCLLCHARVLPTKDGPKVVEGISNPFIDFQGLHQDMVATIGGPVGLVIKRNPKANSFVNAGDALGVLEKRVRSDDGSFKQIELGHAMGSRHLKPELQDFADFLATLPLMKTPAWTSLAAKKEAKAQGYYADGAWTAGFSHVLGGMMISLDTRGSDFIAYSKSFDQHAWPYIQSLKSPEYPWKDRLDPIAIESGQEIFEQNCSSCHGSYEPVNPTTFKRVEYNAELISLNRIGTDSRRANYTNQLIEKNKKSDRRINNLDQQTRGGVGYVAPPMDGIWARAPYFHNGSVPNLSQVLNSKSRFKVYATDLSKNDPLDDSSFDVVNGGWKVEDYSSKSVEAVQLEIKENPYLRVFDPRSPDINTQAGLGNSGHTFGDDLSKKERADLIQFLFTL